jgi:hypothetical protein
VKPPEVLIVGGGMIVLDQILPSLYHLQRLGQIGRVTVCARRSETLNALTGAPILQRAFPGLSFRGTLDPFAQAMRQMEPRNIVFVAVPDQLHHEVIIEALGCNQHVCTVKPLVLEHRHGIQIAAEARRRGLLVAIDYHKRFDDRSLMARRAYHDGRFGEFRMGTACLLEKWYYRRSNFQNWMTTHDRLLAHVPAGHDKSIERFIEEQMMERRIRQHETQARISGSHAAGDPRLFAPGKKNDRPPGSLKQGAIRIGRNTDPFGDCRGANHNRKGLSAPALSLSQEVHRVIVGGVADKMESAKALDRQYPAFAKKLADANENSRRRLAEAWWHGGSPGPTSQFFGGKEGE